MRDSIHLWVGPFLLFYVSIYLRFFVGIMLVFVCDKQEARAETASYTSDYVQNAISEERPFRMLYPEHFTRLQIAKALLSRLWSEGHFKLCDLKLWVQWE